MSSTTRKPDGWEQIIPCSFAGCTMQLYLPFGSAVRVSKFTCPDHTRMETKMSEERRNEACEDDELDAEERAWVERQKKIEALNARFPPTVEEEPGADFVDQLQLHRREQLEARILRLEQRVGALELLLGRFAHELVEELDV